MTDHELADIYAKDPAAKTAKGFVMGLNILARYMEKGWRTTDFCGAKYDEITIYVSDDLCPPESEHGQSLFRLGFRVNECGTWSFFT